MVLAGHVTAAGGRIQGSCMWSVSVALARRIWWSPSYSSLSSNSSLLPFRSAAGRRFCSFRKAPQLVISSKGAPRRYLREVKRGISPPRRDLRDGKLGISPPRRDPRDGKLGMSSGTAVYRDWASPASKDKLF